jgi:hypothetical protein
MAKRHNRGGRNRKIDVDREPNGQRRRRPECAIPHAALAQRAAALGIDVMALLRHGSSAVTAICSDPGAGTALGRITWRVASDGSRERRKGDFGGDQAEDWITPAMEAAAEAYRTLWVRWYRMVGLPRRHPQAMTLERMDKGREEESISEDAIRATIERMATADAVLMRCRQPRLVMAVIDSVLIDNVAPDGLIHGERSAALAALRRGLEALHDALCQGKRRAA